jgi:hypothetical protein
MQFCIISATACTTCTSLWYQCCWPHHSCDVMCLRSLTIHCYYDATTATTAGVMLAISTVLSHNVGTIAIKAYSPTKPITQAQLMLIVRCSVPIVAIIAAIVASTYNQTGYLIVVAFDVSTPTTTTHTYTSLMLQSCSTMRTTSTQACRLLRLWYAQLCISTSHIIWRVCFCCYYSYTADTTLPCVSSALCDCTTDCTGWHYSTTAGYGVHS